MGAAAWMTHARLIDACGGAGLADRLVRLSASITTGVLVLAAAARILRIEELEQVGRQVLTRLGRKPAAR